MLLTKEVDYALRICRVLAHDGGKLTSREICRREKIEGIIFVRRILQKLVKNKIVKSKKGVNGGFILINPHTSLDIVIRIFVEMKINSCNKCREYCSIRSITDEIERDILKKLMLIEVKDL